MLHASKCKLFVHLVYVCMQRRGRRCALSIYEKGGLQYLQNINKMHLYYKGVHTLWQNLIVCWQNKLTRICVVAIFFFLLLCVRFSYR